MKSRRKEVNYMLNRFNFNPRRRKIPLTDLKCLYSDRSLVSFYERSLY
jgi:hypothetical protein